MIVNHQYKFIFLKTRKTAGTSIEIALSKFCSEKDIITSVSNIDEEIRQGYGYIGPQNTRIPLHNYTQSSWKRLIRTRRRRVFENHNNARFVRSHLPRHVWKSYFKFAFERNPFDRAVSRYFWSIRKIDHPPPLNEFLRLAPDWMISNWPIYAIDDTIAVDFLGKYESLDEDLQFVRKKLGLPADIELPQAKSTFRMDRRNYRQVLDTDTRTYIEKVCWRECKELNYKWIDSKKTLEGHSSAGSQQSSDT